MTLFFLNARPATRAAATMRSAVISALPVSGMRQRSIIAIMRVMTPTPTGKASPIRSRRVVRVDMLNTVRYPTKNKSIIPIAYMVIVVC